MDDVRMLIQSKRKVDPAIRECMLALLDRMCELDARVKIQVPTPSEKVEDPPLIKYPSEVPVAPSEDPPLMESPSVEKVFEVPPLMESPTAEDKSEPEVTFAVAADVMVAKSKWGKKK